MDAEKRKAELMKENKMGDGKMFKLDFDPRVIGNKILPDGTKKQESEILSGKQVWTNSPSFSMC